MTLPSNGNQMNAVGRKKNNRGGIPDCGRSAGGKRPTADHEGKNQQFVDPELDRSKGLDHGNLSYFHKQAIATIPHPLVHAP